MRKEELRVESSEVNSLKRRKEIEGIAIGTSWVYRSRIGDKRGKKEMGSNVKWKRC
jgi:hypothetical protein